MNPISTIAFRADAATGFEMKELWLYAQLADGLGSFNMSVQFRRFQSDVILGRSQSVAIEFRLDDRLKIHETTFRLRNLRFRKPDSFEFVLLANHVELARAPLQVR